MDAEDGGLRRIDDRRRHHRAEHAAVGNREGAAGEFLDRELAVLGLDAEFGDFGFDFGDGEQLGVAQNRHHQTARAADGDADVDVAVVDDVVAVDGGVQYRVTLERRHGGLDEEAHEAETHAVRFLELLAVLLAQRHHRRHVHLVEGGENGVLVLRLDEALGDAGAQARHRHALFGTVADEGERRGRGGGGRGRSRCGGAGGDGVFLGDATAASAAGHVGGGDAFFFENLARGGADADGRRGCRSSGGGRRGGGRFGCGRWSGGSRGGAGFGVDAGDQFAGGDGFAVALDDFDQHAGGGRRGFEHDLIGFDVDEVFVARDRFAGLFVPGHQRGFRYGFGQRRHFDFDEHGCLLPFPYGLLGDCGVVSWMGPNACVITSFCCCTCLAW